jgi:transcriptional regulator with XRE-family HTH domain
MNAAAAEVRRRPGRGLPLNTAEVIRRRENLGLSQAQLAREAGISRKMMSAVETGQANPSPASAKAIAGVLGCTVEEIRARAPE